MSVDINVSNEHVLAFAARGFARSLTDKQRATFLSLFSGGQHARAALDAAIEACTFERGRSPVELPSPMMIAALEYALPRMSGAGFLVAREIELRWDGLSEETRQTIRDLIDKAVAGNRAGMPMDVAEWLRIAAKPSPDVRTAKDIG
jgi:hypothetical protein